MAVQYAPTKLRVPPGFQNLLEGLSREVLREQPSSIIQFAANYFKDQLLIRNEMGKDDAKKGSDMEKLQNEEEIDIDLQDPSTADAAVKIQAVFRGHKGRQETKQKKEEDQAATKIQAGFRGHQARKSVKEIKSNSSKSAEDETVDEAGGDEKEGGEYVESVTLNEDVGKPEDERAFDDPKYEHAATKIQAGFRGYKTREEMSEKLSKSKLGQEGDEKETQEVDDGVGAPEEQADNLADDQGKEEEIDIDLEDPSTADAALKIQAVFRGHKGRQEKKQKKEEDQAATKIQAGFRGHVARKEVAAMKSSEEEIEVEKEGEEDLTKHEAAAVKIQAGYRGFVARKEVDALKATQGDKELKTEEEDTATTTELVVDDEERGKAATRIQASYRGYRTRASMKSDDAPESNKASEEEPANATDVIEAGEPTEEK